MVLRPRLLIGSPIRQKPVILQLFLNSLEGLEKDSYDIFYLFIDDNVEEASSNILKSFALSKDNVTIVGVEELEVFSGLQQGKEKKRTFEGITRSHDWREENVWKVADMKDYIIAAASEGNYSHLFFADSDLLFNSNTLEHLLECDKEIVSTIFWTSWQPNTLPLPQVWLHGEYELLPMTRKVYLDEAAKKLKQQQFLAQLREPGLYEVGGLGASTLISKSAIDKGVSFREIPNLSYWGEDRHFCVRAAALGIKLYVDTWYPAYHIYRESDLEGVQDFLKHSLDKRTNQQETYATEAEKAYARACQMINYGYDAVAAEEWNRLLKSDDATPWQKVRAYLELDAHYGRNGDAAKGRMLLLDALESLRYAELYCRLGAKCMDNRNWSEAASWYQAAITTLRPDDWEKSPDVSSWTWKPYIQLCVCYYELGDLVRSFRYNEHGLALNPTHKTLQSNREVLMNKMKEAKEEA